MFGNAIIILSEGGDPVIYREDERAPIDALVDDGLPYLATPEADDQLEQAGVPTETLSDDRTRLLTRRSPRPQQMM